MTLFVEQETKDLGYTHVEEFGNRDEARKRLREVYHDMVFGNGVNEDASAEIFEDGSYASYTLDGITTFWKLIDVQI